MVRIYLPIITLMVNGVLTTSNVGKAPLVHLGESTIEGKVLETKPLKVNQYLGIPYAQPPIGDLRFTPTQPLHSFPKALRAVTQPPACHQYSPVDTVFVDNSPGHSEDCLYLNIWTPAEASPSNTKAVLYWMHGGSFQFGSIRQDLYNGTQLASLGDIVVVTVNYRLGPLGFLTSNTEHAPGNAGFWDVLEGLKWVNRNIKAFGGDPDKITVSGASAGAIFVGLLSISPLSKGLFRRQIMESGSPAYLVLDNTTRNEMNSEYVSSQVGCSNETYTMKDHPKEVIDCLRKTDAAILAKISFKIKVPSSEPFSPQYGDEIMPFNPRRAILNGNFHSTETLIGFNKNEGSVLAGLYSEIFGSNGEKEPHLNKTAAKEFMRMLLDDIPNPGPIINYYLPDTIAEDAFEAIERQIFMVYGEGLLSCPTLYYAEKVADKWNSVFFYYFGHRSNTSVSHPRLGVPHFEEVQFVFGKPLREPMGYNTADIRISMEVIEMWSDFVKYGDPSSSWPLFSRRSPEFHFFGTQTEKFNSSFRDPLQNCDFWRPYFWFLN